MRSFTSSNDNSPASWRAVTSKTTNLGRGVSAPSTMTGFNPTVVSLATTFWYSGGRSVSGASSARRGEVAAVPELHHQRFGALQRADPGARIRRRFDDDLPERHRRGSLRLLVLVLLPEFAHLRVGRWNRAQLSLLSLGFDQALGIQ